MPRPAPTLAPALALALAAAIGAPAAAFNASAALNASAPLLESAFCVSCHARALFWAGTHAARPRRAPHRG